MRLRFTRLRSLALVALLIVTSTVIYSRYTASRSHATSPIQHIVWILKENRSFDMYFGAYGNGVNGATTGVVKVNGVDKTIPLSALVDSSPHDYSHDWGSAHADYDGGKMDAFNRGNCSKSPYPCYQQAQRSNIPNYWSYADHFVLSDNTWSELEGPSFPNHMYTVAAASGPDIDHSAINNPANAKVNNVSDWGCDSPSGATVQLHNGTKQYPCFSNTQTLADELTSAGTSWRYYAPQKGEPGYAWNALDPFKQDGPGTTIYQQHDVEWTNFASDAASGNLPAFSWLTPPLKYSEHPFDGGGSDSVCSGENWTVKEINAVMQSPEWSSTVIIVTWDDFGGWYDHVPPTQVDALGYGFRTPMLIISPFAFATDNPGNPHVAHTKLEFASVLQLAEQVFGLAPLTQRDANAGNLMTELDTSMVHNPPLTLPLRTTCPYS